ncbi:hypothetical protein LI90_1811 [Carbonactinospora thermoautotrophica]|uniref:Uncharacterized protein n=1 Tax=Carbonactinospora thermoautotrophica TaxID=1469144 RepID=A0A132MSD9_9ACTN|nr:hypothetical protein [Carbonactinospora thermoautotrophica]KWX00788.1 hypothetical protein LI90_1811 [Carbonactinospora thermoautotrophica]
MGEKLRAWLSEHRLETAASATGVLAAILGITLAGEQALAAAFGLFVAITLVLLGIRLAGRDFGAWTIGLAILAAPPLVLLLVSDGVAVALGRPDDARMYVGLAVIYLSGSVGGLVLELLPPHGFRVELPSVRNLDGERCHAADGSGEMSGRGDHCERRWDVGFLGRMFVGGTAALVLLAIADAATHALRVTTDVNASVIAWSIAIGAAAVAAWRVLSKAVGVREQFVLRQLSKISEVLTAAQEPQPAPVAVAPRADGQPEPAVADSPRVKVDLRLSRTKARLAVDEDTIRDLIEAHTRDEVLAALSWSPGLAETVDQALLATSPKMSQDLAAVQGRLKAAMDALCD